MESSGRKKKFQNLVERAQRFKGLETRRCSITDSDSDSDQDFVTSSVPATNTNAKTGRDFTKGFKDTNPNKDLDPQNSAPEKLFKLQAAKAFDKLFTNLQLLCRMEAEEHLQEARWFDNACFYLELAARLLGVASVSGVVTFIVNWIPDGRAATDSPASRLGILGAAGVFLAGVLQYVGRGSAKILPSFRKRSDEHRKASAAWMELKQDVKLVRIKLRDPDFSVEDVEGCYRDAVSRRRQLSESILVSLKTADWVHDELLQEIKKSELGYLKAWPIGESSSSGRKDRGCVVELVRTTVGEKLCEDNLGSDNARACAKDKEI